MVHWAQNRKGKAMKKERKKVSTTRTTMAALLFIFYFILYFIILFTFILLLYVLSNCVISCTIIPLHRVCLCLSVLFLVCLPSSLFVNRAVITIYLLNANWLDCESFLCLEINFLKPLWIVLGWKLMELFGKLPRIILRKGLFQNQRLLSTNCRKIPSNENIKQ